MDISGNNNNRTGTLIVVQRKNYLTPIIIFLPNLLNTN
jgi:hypothetical protein